MLALAVECVCAAPQQMGSTPVIEDQCEPHIRAPHHPSPSCKSLMPQFEFYVAGCFPSQKRSGPCEWAACSGLWWWFAIERALKLGDKQDHHWSLDIHLQLYNSPWMRSLNREQGRINASDSGGSINLRHKECDWLICQSHHTQTISNGERIVWLV